MESRMRMTFHKLCFVLAGVVGILLQAPLRLAQEITPSTSNVNRKFQAKQLQEDFLILRKVLEEAHPSLYRYTDKKVFDADFDNAFKRLNEEMTEREFFPIVASIVSAIKDGHTGIMPSSEYMNYLKKMFPLNLRFIKGKAYIISSPNNSITPGSELLSINGKKMSGITHTILAHLPADGDIETGKYWLLNQRFSLFYNVFIEQPDSFNVEYYDAAKRQKKKISVPPLENAATIPVPVSVDRKPLRLEFLPESNTALLTINTFDGDTITKAGQDYRQFMEAAFQEMKQKNIQNLIIDLRNNGGGDDAGGSLLFSYLTDKEFRYHDYLETSTNKITFAQYIYDGADFNKFFAERLMPGVAGKFRVKDLVGVNLQQVQQPQKNHFNGRVWYLVNGRSFSGTAEFASIAHYHRRGSFVGEEVGGGYYGNTSGVGVWLTLPNTKVRVIVWFVKYVMAVSGYAYPRRGVMPDYPVQPTIQDVLNGVDTEMIYTLKLIKNGNK
jgi:C-terminal processing protease CtpA/Prc